MWLSDLLPQTLEIRPTRPTRPTSKNDIGRPQSLVAVVPSDTSDTKKAKNILSRENHQKEEGIAQVSSKTPESVRLFSLEDLAPNPIPDYAAFCSLYWRGCFGCQDYRQGPLHFCERYNRSYGAPVMVVHNEQWQYSS